MSEPQSGPRLENRLPAEGINSSSDHPLREAAWLIGATLSMLAVAVLLVGWGAQWLAPRLPFSAEVAIASQVMAREPSQPEAHAVASLALQSLANRIAVAIDLPPDMAVVVRYSDTPLVNAYATVGGHIRVHRGLLKRVRSEDALAALLAHEMAHVKHRHVAANLGRGLALALLLGAVSADAGAAAAQGALGQATQLALTSYTREQESEADAEALRAVVALYGHAGGLFDLFDTLGTATAGAEPPAELLLSHPLMRHRLQAAQARAREQGWQMSGPLAPLPAKLVPPQTQRGR